MKGESNMSKKNENHIDRREFIVTGSLAAAAMSLPSIALAAPKAAPAVLGLSIGFLGETSRSFQAAESVLTGDPTLFSRNARFSFRGMQRFGGERVQVTVDVIYKTDVGDLPFFAFTHSEQKKGAVSNSASSSFVVPVPTTGSIDLVVKGTRASSPEAQATVSFAVNSIGKSALKLNRGAYVFALSDRAVDWSAVSAADGIQASSFISGAKPLLLRTPSGKDVNFDYVVMTVRSAA